METIRQITDELAIAGQITVEQLKQLAQAGYKSVLNLRSPEEVGFQTSEQLNPHLSGLQYINLPIKNTELNPQIALQVLEIINELPKPTLVHCDSGLRSAILIFIYIATKQGMALDIAFSKAISLGLL